jgi:hypothetical protein
MSFAGDFVSGYVSLLSLGSGSRAHAFSCSRRARQSRSPQRSRRLPKCGGSLRCLVYEDLGFIDLEQKTLQPLDNPFGPRLSPMS